MRGKNQTDYLKITNGMKIDNHRVAKIDTGLRGVVCNNCPYEKTYCIFTLKQYFEWDRKCNIH